ncbi:hypothetical protein K439DRAFT_1404782 [Ramaria rubella]|nr:hypothetical protein K439DRAFT_1404782 [Ramaria rubella]
MEKVIPTFFTALDIISSHFNEHPVLNIALISSALIFPFALRNYLEFLKLRPDFGLANPLIYFLSLTLRLACREPRTTNEYDAPNEVSGSWLCVDLPCRSGTRPEIGWFPAPHRQVNQFAPTHMDKDQIFALLSNLAVSYPDTLEIRRSRHELHTDALFVSRRVLEVASASPKNFGACVAAYGEVAHVHDGFDFSLHVVLAPQDCKTVIQKGWGERHPCAGRLKGLPKEYLLIYVPRDTEELKVVSRIVAAAANFMSGQTPSQ